MSEQTGNPISQHSSGSGFTAEFIPISELQKFLPLFNKELSEKVFSYHLIPQPFPVQFAFACDFFKAFVNGNPLPESIPNFFEKWFDSGRYKLAHGDDSIFTLQDEKGQNKSRGRRVFDLFIKFDNWGERGVTFEKYFKITNGLQQHLTVVQELLNVLKRYDPQGSQADEKLQNVTAAPSLITSFQWLSSESLKTPFLPEKKFTGMAGQTNISIPRNLPEGQSFSKLPPSSELDTKTSFLSKKKFIGMVGLISLGGLITTALMAKDRLMIEVYIAVVILEILLTTFFIGLTGKKVLDDCREISSQNNSMA